MSYTRRGLDVLRVRRQGWDVALAETIIAEGQGLPVAAEEHRVQITRRGLDVLRARWQGWDIASAASIEAEGYDLPVAAEQHRVSTTHRGRAGTSHWPPLLAAFFSSSICGRKFPTSFSSASTCGRKRAASLQDFSNIVPQVA